MISILLSKLEVYGITSKGPGKRGHIVADTLLPTQMFPRLPARATFVADTNFVSGTQKCFWFRSETFCVRNKCFPFCAAQQTSWATMCPQQCVLVYQGLKEQMLLTNYLKGRRSSVVIGGVQSDYRLITHGVPQGSVLRPLQLFINFVNDLPNSQSLSQLKTFTLTTLSTSTAVSDLPAIQQSRAPRWTRLQTGHVITRWC